MGSFNLHKLIDLLPLTKEHNFILQFVSNVIMKWETRINVYMLLDRICDFVEDK